MRSLADRFRLGLVSLLAVGGLAMVITAPVIAGDESPELAGARTATAAFHALSAAEAAGYGFFYTCTDEAGLGAMGQHFVNGALVGDAIVDPLRPEVLVYEPRQNGGYKLVAVEYVVFKDAWDAANADPPRLFGQTLSTVGAPNRYGLPPFYEIHAWIWHPNPSGMFNDWNPLVTCRGTGD
jgi:hypothetical protein